MERLLEYQKKCKILKQIQSDKAFFLGGWCTFQNIITVLISSFITYIGFSGIDKITKYINWFHIIEIEKVEFIFNLLILALFVNVILYLVFHFERRKAESEKAIVGLASLDNYTSDKVDEITKANTSVTSVVLELVRQKYEILTQVIPSNTDGEYFEAKKKYNKKEATKLKYNVFNTRNFNAENLAATAKQIILKVDINQQILNILRDMDESLYLGGGVIRNTIWDFLHCYTNATPIEDVDVIYFNKMSCTKTHDELLERKLTNLLPNLKWSVKNQARMHIWNNEPAYDSLEDAISKWPETSTALIARIDKTSNELILIAPHGLGDLFRLIVINTPHFESKKQKYIDRITSKNWDKKWPYLRIIK